MTLEQTCDGVRLVAAAIKQADGQDYDNKDFFVGLMRVGNKWQGRLFHTGDKSWTEDDPEAFGETIDGCVKNLLKHYWDKLMATRPKVAARAKKLNDTLADLESLATNLGLTVEPEPKP